MGESIWVLRPSRQRSFTFVTYDTRVGRDEKILEVAEELFFERSFDAVGVDEIGEAAGVTGSAIYRHFEGKNEILATLFDRAIDAMLVGLTAPHDDPHQELRQLIDGLVSFALTHRRLAGIWEREHRALAEPYKRRYQRRLRRYVERWTDCLERLYPGWSADRLLTATRAVQALLMSDATRSGGPAGSKDVGPFLADMAVRSLEALGESGTERSRNGRSQRQTISACTDQEVAIRRSVIRPSPIRIPGNNKPWTHRRLSHSTASFLSFARKAAESRPCRLTH
ncbi:TetR/AcrR family transcriptional regulator [Rhodococcus opacus]|nr:TetR/AcrR family transcriptional regulator [Rhodococcus opacus]